MKSVKQAFIILLSLVLTTSCAQPNLLTDVSDTDSDDALYYEAKKKLDALEWDEAIDIIENQLSPTYAAKVSVKETLAGAYAGKCGFTFVDILSGMQNSPSANIFPFFVSIFGGNTLDTASCDQAISIISGLGTVLQRTQDQNLFMTILGIARIGTTLGAKLDPTNDGVADGVYNTDFNVCHNYSGGPGSAATDGWPQPGPIPAPVVAPTRTVTDIEAKKVASGIGLIFENISALASVLSGDNSTLTALQDALGQCELVAGAGNCTATNEAAVTDELLYTIRVLMDANGMGFGTCDPTKVYPDAAACCPRLKIPGF
ncbi:hypothetical protein ACNH6C_07560 [Bdellovibrio bacteriovorus]|uniref:hypothetical protein n=1 Tax=Bdellovibrio bacteriovorus TaxID=959 RepID=UPI003A807AEE